MPLKKSFDFQAGDKKEITITSGDISPQYLVVSVKKTFPPPTYGVEKAVNPLAEPFYPLYRG